MRKYLYILAITVFSFSFQGCGKDDNIDSENPPAEGQIPGSDGSEEEINNGIPEGYFEVTFTSPSTRAVVGPDSRIKDLLYLVYDDSNDKFVKQRHMYFNANQVWPVVVKDTLPLGPTYRAVFFGNVDKKRYPYIDINGQTAYQDVIYNYDTYYTDGRLRLPNVEMADDTEIYRSKPVTFSSSTSNPTILLQRAIGIMALGRDYIDPVTAYNSLVSDLNTKLNYKITIETAGTTSFDSGISGKIIEMGVLNYLVFGGSTLVETRVKASLRSPVLAYLYSTLFDVELKKKIGSMAFNDPDPKNFMSYMDKHINIWHRSDVRSVVLKTNAYTLVSDLDLNSKKLTTNNGLKPPILNVGDDDFKIKYNLRDGPFGSKDLILKDFASYGLIFKFQMLNAGAPQSRIIMDNTEYPSYEITDVFPINSHYVTESEVDFLHRANLRYKSKFHFNSLVLTNYLTYIDAAHTIDLSLRLGDMPNYNSIMDNLRDTYWSLVSAATFDTYIRTPFSNVVVTVSNLRLPSFVRSNFNLKGNWDEVNINTIVPY